MSQTSQYQIYLQNKSDEVKRFFIFNEIPKVSNDGMSVSYESH